MKARRRPNAGALRLGKPSQNPYCIAMTSARTLDSSNRQQRGVPMSGQTQEAELQHLLHMVESAQRAGRSESEIGEIIDDAIEADADLERAA